MLALPSRATSTSAAFRVIWMSWADSAAMRRASTGAASAASRTSMSSRAQGPRCACCSSPSLYIYPLILSPTRPYSQVVLELTVSGSVDDFKADDFKSALAKHLEMDPELIEVTAKAASLLVTAIVTVESSNVSSAGNGDSTGLGGGGSAALDAVAQIQSALAALDTESASNIFNVQVLAIEPPAVTSEAATINDGVVQALQAEANGSRSKALAIAGVAVLIAGCAALFAIRRCRRRLNEAHTSEGKTDKRKEPRDHEQGVDPEAETRASRAKRFSANLANAQLSSTHSFMSGKIRRSLTSKNLADVRRSHLQDIGEEDEQDVAEDFGDDENGNLGTSHRAHLTHRANELATYRAGAVCRGTIAPPLSSSAQVSGVVVLGGGRGASRGSAAPPPSSRIMRGSTAPPPSSRVMRGSTAPPPSTRGVRRSTALMAQGSSEGSNLPVAVELPQVPVSMPASLEVAGDALDLTLSEHFDLAKDFTEESAAEEAVTEEEASAAVKLPVSATVPVTGVQEEDVVAVEEEEDDESFDETQPVYLASGWSSPATAHLTRQQEQGGASFALPQPRMLASPALAASLSAAALLAPQSSTSSHTRHARLAHQRQDWAPMPQEGLSGVAVGDRSAEPSPDTDTIVQRI